MHNGGHIMFDMEKINNLTADEVLIVNGLQAVAKEAKEHVALIHKTYNCFGIGKDTIELWHDSYNAEYLTHDGIWQARYLHQQYDVKVDVATVFDYYRAEWLVNNGYVDEYNASYLTDYGKKKFICGYFRSFVRRINIS